jgi:hypothetical protein
MFIGSILTAGNLNVDKNMELNLGGVVSFAPATEDTGAVGREIESRQGIGR